MIKRSTSSLLRCTESALFLFVLLLPATPSFAEPTAPADPVLKQVVEQLIDQYIRAYPEVIEQSLQALEANGEAEDKAHVKQALVTRQQDLLHDPASPVSGNPSGDVTWWSSSITAAATANAWPAR